MLLDFYSKFTRSCYILHLSANCKLKYKSSSPEFNSGRNENNDRDSQTRRLVLDQTIQKIVNLQFITFLVKRRNGRLARITSTDALSTVNKPPRGAARGGEGVERGGCTGARAGGPRRGPTR